MLSRLHRNSLRRGVRIGRSVAAVGGGGSCSQGSLSRRSPTEGSASTLSRAELVMPVPEASPRALVMLTSGLT